MFKNDVFKLGYEAAKSLSGKENALVEQYIANEYELDYEQVEKLQQVFAEDYAGIKDNFDDAFDYWLSSLSEEEIIDLLK